MIRPILLTLLTCFLLPLRCLVQDLKRLNTDLGTLSAKVVHIDDYYLAAFVPYANAKHHLYPTPLHRFQIHISTAAQKSLTELAQSPHTLLTPAQKNSLQSITVRPNGSLHLTLFHLGTIPVAQQPCTVDAIVKTFNAHTAALHTSESIALRSSMKLAILGKFIVLLLPPDQLAPWDTYIHALDKNLRDTCHIQSDFLTKHDNTWLPHVSLCTIGTKNDDPNILNAQVSETQTVRQYLEAAIAEAYTKTASPLATLPLTMIRLSPKKENPIDFVAGGAGWQAGLQYAL